MICDNCHILSRRSCTELILNKILNLYDLRGQIVFRIVKIIIKSFILHRDLRWNDLEVINCEKGRLWCAENEKKIKENELFQKIWINNLVYRRLFGELYLSWIRFRIFIYRVYSQKPGRVLRIFMSKRYNKVFFYILRIYFHAYFWSESWSSSAELCPEALELYNTLWTCVVAIAVLGYILASFLVQFLGIFWFRMFSCSICILGRQPTKLRVWYFLGFLWV